MSGGHEGRDSENNWVIPSAEGFPVETVGAAQDGAEEAGAAGSEPAVSPDSEEIAQPPDVKPRTEIAEEPERADEEQGPPSSTEGPRGPSTAGGDLEEVSCSSSEDDVEGLRKRVGQGAPPASVGPSVREAVEQETDGGSSWNLSTLVIAAFGLICMGLLVFSGGSFSSDDDPPQSVVSRSVTGGDAQPPQVIADIQDWIEQHAEHFTGDPSSLQVMSGLLDKVAKENQEIRHMQATLQAEKEELGALLSVSDGGKMAPALSEENIRLKEETAHLEGSSLEKEALLKEDLEALRLQIEGFLAQKETLVAESQMLRQELDKQRFLVASIRQELDNLVTKSDEGQDEKLLQERLSDMSSRLAMEAERSDTWEKKYVAHVGEDRRVPAPGGDFRKTHHKHGKEHGKRWTEETHRESQHQEWRSRKQDDKHQRDKKHRHWEGENAGDETWKTKAREHRSKESAPHHHHQDYPQKAGRHHQGEAGGGFHPRKGQKDFTDSHKRREDREKDHRHHDHNKFWKKLSDHQYRVPEGCSSLEDCARKDGVDLFNMELKPVQRKQFEEVLLNYLTKSQLSEHLPELTPLLDGFFEGPLFSHHKIRFKDFVDDVEDFLEDLARKEMGNDDMVDDFERYVYTSFFGEGATKKRFAKDEQQETGKYHKQSGKLEKTYDQSINQSKANKPFTTALHVDSHDFKPIKKHKTHGNDKAWPPNTQHEEESDHKYDNKDHPKTHHRLPKHNEHDKNDGSFHHPEKNPKYPHTNPGREEGGHYHDAGRLHNIQYKEDGAWQKGNHDKFNYSPQNHGHQNTYKDKKMPDERIGKDSYKYKHKSPEKYKEDEEHKHNPKKHEKDAHNKHYRSSQIHESHDDRSPDHKSWRDDNQQCRQPGNFHRNSQGPTHRYPSKAYYHKHEENEGRTRNYHHQHDESDDYHQKHGKDKHRNYHQMHERSKDHGGDYHHQYDKDHQKREDDRDYPHKHDKDHQKQGDDRDHHHKYDKDHQKQRDDRDHHHKYDKDHQKQGDDRDYHHKYDKDHQKHGDDRDYHHKHDKDHQKHGDDRDYHHKYDKDHQKQGDDRDYHHKHDKDHHKHKEDKDKHRNYHQMHERSKDNDGDHQKYDDPRRH